MTLEQIFLLISAFIIGAIFGSFACCQAWRIHEKSAGKKLGSRSICMSCKKKLKWFDNIPIFSWLILRGKCRNCHKKIGASEILSEIGLGLAFLAVAFKYSDTLLSLTNFAEPLILFLSLVIFWILLVYDAKWGELPVFLMLVLVPLAVAFQFFAGGDLVQTLISTSLLSGIYYLLYFFSKEKLVGGGDWLLCLSIGIFLGRFEFAILELFLSNLAASLAGIPQILKKSKKPIPFGPFLIISMLVILLLKSYLLKFLVIY